jgi:alpha-L-fucosidase
MNTECKRDIIKEYVEACRKEGLAVGIYYSPMDWRFEGFFFPKMYRKSALAMRAQAHAQIEELVDNYGKIDIMWYDGGDDYWLAHSINLNTLNPKRDDESPMNYRKNPPIPEFWGEYELDKMVRTKQPHIVINNRLGMHRVGDYTTPERVIGAFDPIHPWETCDTLADTWGWTPNCPIMSLKDILHLLIDVVTGGGNLLLNVSPKGDGSLEPEHEARLLEVGEWMEKYGKFIYGTYGGPMKNDKSFGGFTYKGNSLYLFLKSGAEGVVKIPLLTGNVKNTVCHTEATVKTEITDGDLKLLIGGKRADVADIVELEFDRPIDEIFADFNYKSFNAFESLQNQQ